MNIQNGTTQQATLTIGGMACSACANTVQQALNDLEGVQEASVDLENESGSVSYEKYSVSTDEFKEIIENAGYEFKDMKS
jgi:copper chaperone CopZ